MKVSESHVQPGQRYVVVAGPTGSGKSALAMALASELAGEIINCDSVQVYRGFDIGAAKVTAAERQRVPHHLLDVAEAHDSFDAALFATAAHAAKSEILARGALPLVVGGTGLYLRALLGQGWNSDLPQDPELRAKLATLSTSELHEQLQRLDAKRAAELHPNDRVRLLRAVELVTLLGKPLNEAGFTGITPPDPAAFVIVLEPPRAKLHERIAARTRLMLESGLIEEVRALIAAGVSPSCKPMQSIGYKQVCDYLAGQLGQAELAEAIMAATRQYAKRQCTWFRSTPTHLRLDGSEALEAVVGAVRQALSQP